MLVYNFIDNCLNIIARDQIIDLETKRSSIDLIICFQREHKKCPVNVFHNGLCHLTLNDNL